MWLTLQDRYYSHFIDEEPESDLPKATYKKLQNQGMLPWSAGIKSILLSHILWNVY